MTWPKNMYLTRKSHNKRVQTKMGTDVRLGISSSTGTSFTPKMTLAGEMSSCSEAPAAANCESVNTRCVPNKKVTNDGYGKSEWHTRLDQNTDARLDERGNMLGGDGSSAFPLALRFTKDGDGTVAAQPRAHMNE